MELTAVDVGTSEVLAPSTVELLTVEVNFSEDVSKSVLLIKVEVSGGRLVVWSSVELIGWERVETWVEVPTSVVLSARVVLGATLEVCPSVELKAAVVEGAAEDVATSEVVSCSLGKNKNLK